MKDDNCIFCKIVAGEIPSDKLYENDKFLVFLTIEPVSDGHLLIIPKEHVVWMYDASDETISQIFVLAKKLMLAMKKAFNSDYVQLSITGEEIAHFHIHLFGRLYDDGLLRYPNKKYKEGEVKEIVKKIISSIS